LRCKPDTGFFYIPAKKESLMKQIEKVSKIPLFGFIAIAAIIVFSFTALTACGDGSTRPEDPTPKAADFDIGNLSQAVVDITDVTITLKPGKSSGVITAYYEGTSGTTYAKGTTLPREEGTYAVTFDVAAAQGWKAAKGLSAGTLTVGTGTPTAADFDIGNLMQAVVDVSAVTITPKSGKSGGEITIYYEGTSGTAYAKSTTLPAGEGIYTVTFDVAAVKSWKAVTGLSAGTLTVNTFVAGNPIPTAADYDIGNLSQAADIVTGVTITPKAGKSSGAVVNIRYAGNMEIPQTNGTYAVTFDVAAASGWNAASGLYAGTLTVSANPTPTAADYDIGNLSQAAGSVTAVTITPKTGKSSGAVVNIRYADNAEIPQTSGTYAVTFDVAAASGWNAASGLYAGNLIIGGGSRETAIPLTENTWVGGNIAAGGQQWFKFTAAETMQFFHINFGSLQDMNLQVYTGEGDMMGSQTRLYDGTRVASQGSLVPGQVHFIKIWPYNGAADGSFQIAVTASADAPAVTPDVGAAALTIGEWANGSLAANGQQWFKFTASADTHLFYIEWDTLTGSLYAQVYTGSGAPVGATATVSTAGSALSRTFESDEVYYIRVWPASRTATGTFKIAYTAASSTAPVITLPTTGVTELTGTWADGSLAAGGQQWFKFTAASSRHYIHVFFGTLTQMSVQMYTSDGGTVSSEAVLAGANQNLVRSCQAGQTYYIRVRSQSTADGTYRIAVNAGATAPVITLPVTGVTELTADTFADGTIVPAGGSQWFKFTATAAIQNIHTTFGTLNNMYVQVYTSSGVPAANAVNLTGSTRMANLSSLASGQEYYIKVWAYTPIGMTASSHGTYRIGFSTLPFIADTNPPVLTAGNWTSGNLAFGQTQYFKFTATAATQYICFRWGTLSDVNVNVYSASTGTLMGAQQNQYGGNAHVGNARTGFTTGEEYFIAVTPYYSSGANVGSYRITFSNTNALPPE
jgi:hypothetical protein